MAKKASTKKRPEADIVQEIVTDIREHKLDVRPQTVIDFIKKTYGIDEKDFVIRIFDRNASQHIELNDKASISLIWKKEKLVKFGPKSKKKTKVRTRTYSGGPEELERETPPST
jgi:hypothetical protein